MIYLEVYYTIRHKATGELMPLLDRNRGYSHWNPSEEPTNLRFGRRKLIGVPRIFVSRKQALRVIAQWNALPNCKMSYTVGYFGSEEVGIDIKPDGRKKEDLEIVEVELEEVGIV